MDVFCLEVLIEFDKYNFSVNKFIYPFSDN